jgi:hypothetical protein
MSCSATNHGVPHSGRPTGVEVGATPGVLWSMLRLMKPGITHLAWPGCRHRWPTPSPV